MNKAGIGRIRMLALAATVASCGAGGGTASSPGSGVDVSCGPGMYIADTSCVALPPIGGYAGADAATIDATDDEGGAPDAPPPDGGVEADVVAPNDGGDAFDPGDAGRGPVPDPTASTAFLINPAHTGAVSGATLTPPLERLWDVTATGSVSYPVLANGLVFVASGASASAHAALVALDASSGSVAWRADLGMTESAALAYDQGLVIEVDSGVTATTRPVIRAYEAATGQQTWMALTDVSQSFFGPPTPYRGILYVYGSGEGATLYAYDESDGSLLWRHPAYGSWGAPAASDQGVFVGDPCSVFAVDRRTGADLWQKNAGCSGGGGAAPVLFDTVLYARAPSGGSALATTSGSTLGTFKADYPPAFGLGLGFYVASGALNGSDYSLTARAWTFAPDGGVSTAPVVAGDYVYVGSGSGEVFAVDARTGNVAWSDHLGTPILLYEAASVAPAALAAAQGVLVVPSGNDVVGYGSAPRDAGAREGGDG